MYEEKADVGIDDCKEIVEESGSSKGKMGLFPTDTRLNLGCSFGRLTTEGR